MTPGALAACCVAGVAGVMAGVVRARRRAGVVARLEAVRSGPIRRPPLAGPVAAAPRLLVAATARLLPERARLAVDRELPEVLEAVSRGVRAGLSLPTAFVEGAAQAGPAVAPTMAAPVAALAAGRSFERAIRAWSGSGVGARSRGIELATAALLVAGSAGGNRARALDAVAATLRERHALGRDAHALATQARLSALVLVVAPLVFAVFVAGADRRTLAFLVGTPGGWFCLGTGLVLDALGGWWMARLAARCRP